MCKTLFFSLLMLSTFGAFAQTEALTLPTMQAGEASARQFFKALQENDSKTLQNFVASKETYLQIVEEYQYKEDTKRQQARTDVQTGYEKQAANILKSFQDTRAAIGASGVNIADCKVNLVQVRDRQREGLRGGRALIQLTNAAQNEIVLILRGFYEFKGKWYVMNEVRLRQTKAIE